MRAEGEFFILRSLELTENGFAAAAELLPEHPVYAGHFPQQAVVPGVCTLTVVRECAEKYLGRSISFATIAECKFLSALLPCKGLVVNMDFAVTGSSLSGTVSRADDGRTVMKLKASIKDR